MHAAGPGLLLVSPNYSNKEAANRHLLPSCDILLLKIVLTAIPFKHFSPEMCRDLPSLLCARSVTRFPMTLLTLSR